MSNSLLYTLMSIVFLALLAGSVRAIRKNLIHRPADEIRPVIVTMLQLAEWTLWLLCIAGCIYKIRHPELIILFALIAVSIIAFGSFRSREERASFNRWLRMAADLRTPLPRLLEFMSVGYQDRLTLRIKKFTNRIHQGQPFADAALQSKVPIDPDTMAALIGGTGGNGVIGPRENVRRFADWRQSSGSNVLADRQLALAYQQFAYIVVMIVLAWLISMAVRLTLFPMFDEMADEFSKEYAFPNTVSTDVVGRAVMIGNFVIVLLLFWLEFVALIRWLPNGLIRLIPWFGSDAIQRWRGEVLRSLGRGMCAGQSTSAILKAASECSSVSWIRRRCTAVAQIIDSGASMCDALRESGLISKHEATWLGCAERSGTLAEALGQLGNDIPRRVACRWQIRMSWFLPFGTLLVGLFVLAHAVYVIRFLSTLIQEMT